MRLILLMAAAATALALVAHPPEIPYTPSRTNAQNKVLL